MTEDEQIAAIREKWKSRWNNDLNWEDAQEDIKSLLQAYDRLKQELERVAKYENGIPPIYPPEKQKLLAEIDRLKTQSESDLEELFLYDCLKEEYKELKTERETVVMDFAISILHGDQQHQAWLFAAAKHFINGLPAPPLPPPPAVAESEEA